MSGSAGFIFYGTLNDFLPPAKRNKLISFSFYGNPAVKDSIEAIGVPHPEVDVILVNGLPADFSTALHAQDQVEVYPATAPYQLPVNYSLQAGLPASTKFVLDVHLGKLAKALRLLGFDSHYQNDYDDAAIVQLGAQENRIILTRDIGLLKHKAVKRGYWLRSQHLEEQLREVLLYFRLREQLRPFTRCLECNGRLEAVPKEAVLEKLPPNTRLYFQEFYQCPACERVYWKGSHYERMQAFIHRLNTSLGNEERHKG